jgi:hypothetical protein
MSVLGDIVGVDPDALESNANSALTVSNWLRDPLGMAADKTVGNAFKQDVTQGGDFDVFGGLAYFEPYDPELAEFGADVANGKFGLTSKGRIALMLGVAAVVGLVVFK